MSEESRLLASKDKYITVEGYGDHTFFGRRACGIPPMEAGFWTGAITGPTAGFIATIWEGIITCQEISSSAFTWCGYNNCFAKAVYCLAKTASVGGVSGLGVAVAAGACVACGCATCLCVKDECCNSQPQQRDGIGRP